MAVMEKTAYKRVNSLYFL